MLDPRTAAMTLDLSYGILQRYKVERIDVRMATVCWPARKTGYCSSAASAPRQQPASRDGNGAGGDGKNGKGNSQPDGSAESHALGPSRGVVVLGLRVRVMTKPHCAELLTAAYAETHHICRRCDANTVSVPCRSPFGQQRPAAKTDRSRQAPKDPSGAHAAALLLLSKRLVLTRACSRLPFTLFCEATCTKIWHTCMSSH